jgi:hypothetical protein
MKTSNLPATIKFTNGLTANRLNHFDEAIGGYAPYSVYISGFNDPLLSVPVSLLTGDALDRRDPRIKTISRGLQS